MIPADATWHEHRGTRFAVYHTKMGWLANVDGAVPGGRGTAEKAVEMAHTWIDNNGTLCPQAHDD